MLQQHIRDSKSRKSQNTCLCVASLTWKTLMSTQGEYVHGSGQPEMTVTQNMPSSNKGDLENKNQQSNSKLNLIQVYINTPNYWWWYSDLDLSQILNSQLSTCGPAIHHYIHHKLPHRSIHVNITNINHSPHWHGKSKSTAHWSATQRPNVNKSARSGIFKVLTILIMTTLPWSYRYYPSGDRKDLFCNSCKETMILKNHSKIYPINFWFFFKFTKFPFPIILRICWYHSYASFLW